MGMRGKGTCYLKLHSRSKKKFLVVWRCETKEILTVTSRKVGCCYADVGNSYEKTPLWV